MGQGVTLVKQFGNPTFNSLTVTGPTNLSGSLSISGSINVNGNVTASNSTFDTVAATNNGNGTNFKVGDDAWIGDVNAANTIRVKGQQDATAGYITFGNQTTQLGLTNSTTLTWGAAFTATGDVTAFSDVRVKENIKTKLSVLNESSDEETNKKINETLQMVESEKCELLTFFKLKNLNDSL